MKRLTGLKVVLIAFAAMASGSIVFAGDLGSDSIADTAQGGQTADNTAAPVDQVDKLIKDPPEKISDTGYTEEAKAVKAATAKMLETGNAAVAMGALIPYLSKFADLDKLAGTYSSKHAGCVSDQSNASSWCREETSPHLQKMLNQMNPILSLITGATVTNACSSMAKAMQIGQAGLTAYTASCSGARALCDSSCSTVSEALGGIKKMIDGNNPLEISECAVPSEKIPTMPLDQLAQINQACKSFNALVSSSWADIRNKVAVDSDPKDSAKKSIALKKKACTYDYKDMLASAVTGLGAVGRTLTQSNKCNTNSNGNPTTLAAKCAIDANKNTTECLCFFNPRLPGCDNSLQKAGESTMKSLAAQSSPDPAASNTTLTGADLGGTNRDPAAAKATDSAGGAGAPTGGGGGSGLSGSGGGFGGGAGNGSGGMERKGLNANILGGAGGGGGGGAGWGAGGSSSSDSRYRAYLPGGAKDPNRMTGQQQNWAKEVTGQGGKSNWEKVRDRYRDNNGTLLNN